ncbi:MAG: hypothetical protein ACLFPS_09450 [Clostridia bacterium]
MNSLKARQKCGFLHEYTCICGAGPLKVSKDGLYCSKCGYVQAWVHESDLNWRWKAMDPFSNINEDKTTK